jgi:dihydroorotate dehydrogenase (NAD+) catalytic subunit
MKLATKIGKLYLKTPFICASGTFGYGFELPGLVNFKNIGSFITKTITLKPRKGNPPPRIIEVDCGVLNSIGLENPGVDVFIREIIPKIKALSVPFIVSIGGQTLQEYVRILRKLNAVKEISALEINLSCPNIKSNKMISQSPSSTYKAVRALRGMTDKMLIVKVTGEVQDIVSVAKSVEKGGADALSLVNTFFGLAIDINTKKPYLGSCFGGYSGKGIKPLALYRIWKVAKSIHIPIIGGGGISSSHDALEFFLAGAQAVSIGTAHLVDPSFAQVLLEGIKKYMKQHKINDIQRLIGGGLG